MRFLQKLKNISNLTIKKICKIKKRQSLTCCGYHEDSAKLRQFHGTPQKNAVSGIKTAINWFQQVGTLYQMFEIRWNAPFSDPGVCVDFGLYSNICAQVRRVEFIDRLPFHNRLYIYNFSEARHIWIEMQFVVPGRCHLLFLLRRDWQFSRGRGLISNRAYFFIGFKHPQLAVRWVVRWRWADYVEVVIMGWVRLQRLLNYE